jgi:hypothetical protein
LQRDDEDTAVLVTVRNLARTLAYFATAAWYVVRLVGLLL